MNYDTIASVVRDGLCTGCGTCIALCPKEAIELTINEKKGIYIPKLNGEKCNNCGICFKVCPGHEVDFKAFNLEIFGEEPEDVLIGNYLNCYIGHATDYNIRYNSASGGLVTQLLIFALEEGVIDGALVTRMKKDKPLEPESFIARTPEEIIEARGSKYCPVPANVALREILEAEEWERFAVVGMSCHTQGVRKAEQVNTKLREKIILHLGLFCCHAPTFLATEFFLKKMKIKKGEVTKLDYRGKGWPGMTSIGLYNDEKIIHSNIFGNITFASFFFTPDRCMLCSDQTSELADISFGDAWLSELEDDNVGTSIVIFRNDIDKEMLQTIVLKRGVELTEVNSTKVAQSQGMVHFKKNGLKARQSLFRIFGKKIAVYNQKLLKPDISDYLGGILFYLYTFISKKSYLWLLIGPLAFLLKYATKCVSYCKRKIKVSK